MSNRCTRLKAALAGVFLLALFSYIAVGEILLLHGWLGSGTVWTVSRQILREEPFCIDPHEVLSPTLPNRVSLVTWADNIASYLDTFPTEASVTVVAHSFSGPSALFLLVVFRHMEQGDFEEWAGMLVEKDPALTRISSALLALDDREIWVRGACRVSKLFLYQPALGGGCLACSACGEAPLPSFLPEPVGELVGSVVCDDAVKDMCLLSTVRNALFSPEEIDLLQVPVVNIYAIRPGCPGPCVGLPDTDGYVPLMEQRLFLSAPNYHEVAGGAHCHTDFILNLGGAAADLFRTIFPSEVDQEASR